MLSPLEVPESLENNMSDVINPYKVLEVPDYSDIKVCKIAYRKLALQFHPDRNKSLAAHAKMIEINRCMDFLKDPQSKALIDAPKTAPRPVYKTYYSYNGTTGPGATTVRYYGKTPEGNLW